MTTGVLFALAAAFANPPADSRPETWFHLIGGNVSSNGITADLTAAAAAGIGGVQLFHGQIGKAFPWPGTDSQTPCLSAGWEALVRHAADECHRLGLTFKMQNCPGWSMSGGPWIPSEKAMRDLRWSTTLVRGGRVAATLPKPAGLDYRDIAVIAFPAVEGDAEGQLTPTSATGSGPLARLADRIANEGLPIVWRPEPQFAKAPGSAEFVLDYSREVTARTLELSSVQLMRHEWSYEPGVRVELQCECGGRWRKVSAWTMPQSNWDDNEPITLSFPRATSRRWRVVFAYEHPFYIGSVRLHGRAKPHNLESEAGRCLRSIMRDAPVADGEGAYVRSREVRDVTAGMSGDGAFSADLPDGAWTLVRVGHVNAEKQNGPAPEEATGWECDKLSAAGIDASFAGYIGRLTAPGGVLEGRLDGMLIDSWECGSQSWTPGLDRRFEKKYGYALAPFWPALFGYVVDDRETTTRFLRDWRVLLGSSFEQGYFGRMRELAHGRGLSLAFESAGGDTLPADPLAYYKHADVPMCEFWHPRDRCFVGSDAFKPVLPCASAAHVYGKRRVACESFTSGGWDATPAEMRPNANHHFALGVTHVVFHTMTHQPQVGAAFRAPGSTMGCYIGTPFLRGQTWWPFMRGFTDYLARCGTLLEAGLPTSDVLLYLGDEQDHKPPQDLSFPDGFKYDYLNADVLLTRLAVREGRWVTPDGVAYRLIWLRDAPRMLPETLEKLSEGVAAGGVVLGDPPTGSPSLSGGAQAEVRFRRAVAAIWGQARPNVFRGGDVGGVLRHLGAKPDFRATGQGSEGVEWIHRRTGDSDIWFVCADEKSPFHGTLTLRTSLRPAAVADPNTGRLEALAASSVDGATRVELDIPAGDARFVIVGKGAENAERTQPRRGRKRDLSELAWTVEFPPGRGVDAAVKLSRLTPIRDMPISEEGQFFSGTVTYRAVFPWQEGDGTVLDLGRVESCARVRVNGKSVGSAWAPPYAFDLRESLVSGDNRLEVEVTTSWFNRLAWESRLPEERRTTWTTDYPTSDRPLSSGLLGPVSLGNGCDFPL